MTVQPASLRHALPTKPFERLLAIRVPITWEVALYAVIFALAVALRFWDLGSRALHHDESIHAQWSWDLLRGNYRHSPIFHGPFYYHVQGAVFFIFGANDYTSRVSAAIFGSAIVALPLLLRRWLGPVGTIAAVAFLAFSPTVVYYSRFLREDIYMAAFVLLMVAAMWRYFAGDRERWLIVFAAAFTGAMTTKEGTFLTVAVFLIFLDLHVAADLAGQTLRARGLESRLRHVVLTGGYAVWVVPVVALWPLLAGLRRSLDLEERLPRSADVLILLGTMTLPLLTPMARIPLERFGVLETDIPLTAGKFTSRLNWEFHLNTGATSTDRLALAGLFAVTVSAAAYVGLQWKPKLWALCFFGGAIIYLTLMTSFWTNWDGLVSGPWGSLDYWRTQQHVYRGDQPWYYYFMVMPAYEFLTLAICLGGLWWSVVRGNAFSRFLVFWLAGQWLALSYGSEKMPWLNTHLAVPSAILAAWTVNRAWGAWNPRPGGRTVATTLGAVAAASAVAVMLIVLLPGGGALNALKVVLAAALAGVAAYTVRSRGREVAGLALVTAVVAGFAFFSLRTMVQASFTRGDVPKDLLIYTQSSPDIPLIMADINRLAEATGKGYYLPIAVDGSDSFAWPWAWYLRDFKCVSHTDLGKADLGTSTCQGEEQPYQVLLVNKANKERVEDALAQQNDGYYAAPRPYPHRWWFNEAYKSAVQVTKGEECSADSGNCGPFRFATWKTLLDGVVHGGWPATWYKFWRDHDPDDITTLNPNALPGAACKSCGSVDAVAYFPATFDIKTGKLSPTGAPQVAPVRNDSEGRPVFGGAGTFPGSLSSPADIETDAAGNLYVVDAKFRRLQKYDRDGNFLASVPIRLSPSASAEQSEPWGLAVAPDGTIAVADTFGWRVRLFDRDLKPLATFGNPPDSTRPVGPLDLFGPRDLIFDNAGNLWVTDTGHDRIVVYTPAGEFVREFGSQGSGPGQFDEPIGLARADDGTIFVADMYNGRVVLLDSSGDFKSAFPVDGWGGKLVIDKPYLRALRDGRVALSLPAANEVRIYDRSGALDATITGGGEPLDRPYGIAETSDGKVWVVEAGRSRVRQFALP